MGEEGGGVVEWRWFCDLTMTFLYEGTEEKGRIEAFVL